jgi:hypothetical protein
VRVGQRAHRRPGLKVRASQKPCGRNVFGFDLIALSNDDHAFSSMVTLC